MVWHGLTTREWATVFWVAMILVALLAWPVARTAAAPPMKQLLRFWQLHLMLLAWAGVVIYLGNRVGAWNRDLLKDTIAWIVVYSFPTVFSALKAPKEDHFFRRAALSTLSVAALMQFLLNLHTFSIWFELALQPMVTIILTLGTVAALKPETAIVGKAMDWVISIIGIGILLTTVVGLWNSWRGIDAKETGLALAFSIWFPLAMLPFVYVLALVMAYSEMFRRMPLFNDDRKPPLSARVAVAVGLNGDLRAVNDIRQHHPHYRDISRSGGFSAALRHVREYEQAREERRTSKEIAEARVKGYAGNRGMRADGTMLDQREHKETKDALRWSHTCHLGHHNNLGHYRADMMKVLGDFDRQGLPDDHGITMHVSKEGKSWYAWRRTATGYVFGIGASEGTPNEWLYEGWEPPRGFPGQDPSWGSEPLATPPNWR